LQLEGPKPELAIFNLGVEVDNALTLSEQIEL